MVLNYGSPVVITSGPPSGFAPAFSLGGVQLEGQVHVEKALLLNIPWDPSTFSEGTWTLLAPTPVPPSEKVLGSVGIVHRLGTGVNVVPVSVTKPAPPGDFPPQHMYDPPVLLMVCIGAPIKSFLATIILYYSEYHRVSAFVPEQDQRALAFGCVQWTPMSQPGLATQCLSGQRLVFLFPPEDTENIYELVGVQTAVWTSTISGFITAHQ